MTVNAINGKATSALSAVDGRTLSALSAINGQTLVPAFTPLDLPSLAAWLDPANATISGVPEFDWPSTVGAINYGQNTVARQPTLTTVNGNQIVQFGTNKCLVPDTNGILYSTANTLVCVCSKSTNVDQYILKGDGSGGLPAYISDFSSKDFEYFYSGVTERATFAASTDTNLHILTLKRTDDTGNYKGYFDGALAFDNTVSGSADWNGFRLAIIGAFTAGSSNYDGKVGDILHGTAEWNTTQLNNLHTYLGNKWNISVTLN